MRQRNWIVIGSCNDASPVQRQAITPDNADLIVIETMRTKFKET